MSIELWIVCGVVVLMAIPAVRVIRPRRYRRIEDIVTFGRRLSIDDFERITDPAEEWVMRASLAGREFRELQRQRMRLCAEYLARVAHNAEVVQGWSNHEHSESMSRLRNPADPKTYLLWDLAKLATEIRIYTLVMRMELGFWLFLRLEFLPPALVPRLDRMRTVGGHDFLVVYKTMVDLAKEVSQFYGPDWAEKIGAAL